MGICQSNKKSSKNLQTEGELDYVMKKMKKSSNPDEVLKNRGSIDTPFNPYRNPILNRRLRNSTAPTIQ